MAARTAKVVAQALGRELLEIEEQLAANLNANWPRVAQLLRQALADAGHQRKRGRPRQRTAPIPAGTLQELTQQMPGLVDDLRSRVFAPQREGDSADAEKGLREICSRLGFTPARTREAVKKYQACLRRGTLPRQGPSYLARLLLSWKYNVQMNQVTRLRTTPTENSQAFFVGKRLRKVEPDGN